LAKPSPKEPPRPLREWLQRHEQECRDAVETWMIRSLPVATTVITTVWQDPAWSEALRNAVVWPVHEDGTTDTQAAGFLAAANEERGVGVVSLDGETQWLRPEAISIPHPVHLPELEDCRDFATELGLEQQLHQLHRDMWSKPQTRR
jgi:Domain of unknown function (DUF4132)